MRSLVSSRALVVSLVAGFTLVGCGGGGGTGDGTPPGDTTPPTLLSVTPANTASAVALTATVGATFSEPLACPTVTAASFTVTGDGLLAGTRTCAGATVTFTPSVPLEPGRLHDVRITTAVTDVAGNHLGSEVHWAFTVAAADTTRPTVLSTVPASGATGVSVATEIRANLSEPLDCDTATSATFTLAAEGPIPGLVGCQGAVVTFTPSSGLAPSATYTATLGTGLKDAAGNALAAPVAWTFTTGVPPDLTPPNVVSTVPAAGAIGVAVGGALTATFSEAMDPATLTAASFTLRAGAVDVAGSVAASGTTATFTPAAPLAHATVYTATLTTAAKDLAGNALAAPATWTFTTVDAPGGLRFLLDRFGDLYSVREDGSGLIRFTNSFATEAFVGVSPGGMVVYQLDGRSLYAVPADGSALAVPLVNTAATVSFRGFTTTGRAVYAIGYDLYSVTLDGLTTSPLAADPDLYEEDPHFAPGGRVVFRSQTAGGNTSVVSVADDGTDRIVLDGTPGIKTIPFITGTGRVYIERVLGSGFGDQHDLWSVEADGSLLAPIADDPIRWEGFQGIAPDGTLVYDYFDLRIFSPVEEHVVIGGVDLNVGLGGYVGVTAGNRVVYRTGTTYEDTAIRAIGTDGTGDLPLETQLGSKSAYVVHPGGRVLYRFFDGAQGDVRCADAATGAMVALASTSADEFPLGIAPGGRLIYGSMEPNSGSIASLHSVDAACGDHRLLVESATGGITLQGFTSDGRVAYTLSDASGTALFLAGHDGSAPVNLSQVTALGAAAFYGSVP